MSQNRKSKSYKTQTLYTSKDYEKDSKSFYDALDHGRINLTTFKKLMISDLCQKSEILKTSMIGHIQLEDLEKALKHPVHKWRIILEASKLLMHISPHYYRLNMYFSNMALFDWWIDLIGIDSNNTGINLSELKRAYLDLCTEFETMNLKHEFSKIMKVLPYQDIYCGLVVKNKNSFFFQEIDYRICRLYQVQDGLYNYQINLAMINPVNLNAYPQYVRDAYITWYDSKDTVSKWYLPPVDKQICIKMNSQWTYPYPLLIGLIQDILDLDTYKKLKLQSARTDNYKAILIKVPIDETSVDKPLLTPDLLSLFSEINKENMTDDIGLLYTLGTDGQAVSFKDSSNSRNNVSDAVNEIYNSSGESRELFNGSSSGTAVTLSVENDAGFIYGLYRQFERWCNRYIKVAKISKKKYNFGFSLLDITIFNRDTVLKRYKEAVSLGVPVIDKWLSALDVSPAKLNGAYLIHQEIFDFNNNFIPLSSSFNSSSDEAGRPTKASQGETLSDEGEKSADGEKNDR